MNPCNSRGINCLLMTLSLSFLRNSRSPCSSCKHYTKFHTNDLLEGGIICEIWLFREELNFERFYSVSQPNINFELKMFENIYWKYESWAPKRKNFKYFVTKIYIRHSAAWNSYRSYNSGEIMKCCIYYVEQYLIGSLYIIS